MSAHPQRSRLVGRRRECEALDRLVADVRAGEGRVLVLRGEAGVGKTALLQHLIGGAAGCRLARVSGVESEMELPYAGLHQLCSPLLDRAEHLPEPQRDALGTAFGLGAGEPPDRFLVGLAVLTLLAEVAEDEPLICVVDDAQWLDRVSAQTLAFVGRRLLAEQVGLVLAVRGVDDEHELHGLPELVVEGLSAADAGGLLDATLPGRIDERVREQIIAETRGNPLALLEFPRGLSAPAVAGGFGLPATMPLAGQLEQAFAQRLEPLPAPTRQLLLVAAAEPVGDAPLLWRAAGRLGIGPDAATPAHAAGLIELGERVRFRHPLVRSAVYRAATPEERQAVHGVLAEAIDGDADPDRRAWHRAHAASGPDEAVAAELERSAGRAHARGGIAAAAAFLERATALTPDPQRRGERALAAAQAKLQAGAFDPARVLLATAAAAVPRDDLALARIDLLRAQIAFASSHGNDGAPLLLAAARRLDPLDPACARETYLDAFAAAMFAGRLAAGVGMTEVARAAREAPPRTDAPRTSDLLLDGLTVLYTDGYAAALPIGEEVLRAFQDDELPVADGLRWLWLASAVAADMWDDEGWHALAARHVTTAREAGALGELALALNSCAQVQVFSGDLAAAASLAEESGAALEATGSRLTPYGALSVAAWRGREAEALELTEASTAGALARGEGVGLTHAQWATAVLCNGLGRYEDAVTAAREATQGGHELATTNWGLVELVEAAARSGHPELAQRALDRLVEATGSRGGDWALGVEARSRALLQEGEAAEALHREAIERLGRTRMRAELARARLLYGEWLRREGRRRDARDQLREAHDALAEMEAGAFAERARRELAATGETVRRRSEETRDELTAQEAQIARLAAAGLTNPEIGAQLFISPRTVEYHLRKVFAKLGVASRRELRGALPDGGRPAQRV